MRLLFDQNISFRILNKLNEAFPGSSQVRLLGLENKKDIEIWNYAKENNFAIVTFDTDFYDLSLIKGTPPKIIWLRVGNTSTSNLVQCLALNHSIVTDFLSKSEYQEIACLEIE